MEIRATSAVQIASGIRLMMYDGALRAGWILLSVSMQRVLISSTTRFYGIARYSPPLLACLP